MAKKNKPKDQENNLVSQKEINEGTAQVPDTGGASKKEETVVKDMTTAVPKDDTNPKGLSQDENRPEKKSPTPGQTVAEKVKADLKRGFTPKAKSTGNAGLKEPSFDDQAITNRFRQIEKDMDAAKQKLNVMSGVMILMSILIVSLAVFGFIVGQENVSLRDELTLHKSDNKSLKVQKERLTQELNVVERKLEDQAWSLQFYEENNNKLLDSLEQLSFTFADLQVSYHDIYDKFSSLSAQHKDLSNEYHVLLQENEAYQQEIRNLTYLEESFRSFLVASNQLSSFEEWVYDKDPVRAKTVEFLPAPDMTPEFYPAPSDSTWSNDKR